ncbi:hypothetical protein GP486_000666 [Trichoglossum hirsutum]|uniref:MSP domain-containing protein n=1 Tax=Trichoglossum hirsutum TaxID=265104 RepID=A0A9P8LHD7_9PEZI|nr:hypothetical protein GP486_000666 [Trichoglossum hirsutum]
MSLLLDPPELGFRRPFTHEVSQILVLTNPNSDPVAFKVKTTAPKQYVLLSRVAAVSDFSTVAGTAFGQTLGALRLDKK